MLCTALASQQPKPRSYLAFLVCVPGVFITYVMLKNQKVTKKAQ